MNMNPYSFKFHDIISLRTYPYVAIGFKKSLLGKNTAFYVTFSAHEKYIF